MAKSRFIRRDNKTTAWASIVSAVVFCTFSFVYLFYYQDDLLTMEQHVLSKGLTHYNRFLGATIITAILYLAHVGIDTATRRCSKHPALTYFMPAMALAIMTDINPDVDKEFSFGKWLWLMPLLTVVYAAVTFVSAQLLANNDGPSHKSGARIIWENMLIMASFFLFICGTANTDRIFHQRMRIERLIDEGKFKEALNVGKGSYAPTDSSTTMLRVYALSKTNSLGETLFEYRIKGGSKSLLPNGTSVKTMLYSDTLVFHHVAEMSKQKMPPMVYLKWMKKHGWAKAPLEDYLLAGYLLDKNIDGFAREFKASKYTGKKVLPKHFKEALVLYCHIRSNPVVKIHDEVMEADYQDFMNIIKNTPDKRQRKFCIQTNYANTYWFYYWFQQD